MLLAGTAAALVLGSSTVTWAAPAAPAVAKVSNGPAGPGEAGYYINDNGQTRIRDVQFTLQAVPTLEDLNGTTAPGGIGGELCNENTGWAAQIGLEWPAGAPGPVVEYNYTGNPGFGGPGDTLAANPAQSDQDPCVEGGLLNGGAGEKFGNGITVHAGDLVHFEIYYNPQGHHGWHQLKFEVQDYTQDLTRVQTVWIWVQDFYEAGIGVVSENQFVTGGPVNLVNTFTGAFFNWYGNGYGPRFAPRGIDQPAHWDLEMADFVNGSNQVTITPGALTAGNTSFPMLEGSTSP